MLATNIQLLAEEYYEVNTMSRALRIRDDVQACFKTWASIQSIWNRQLGIVALDRLDEGVWAGLLRSNMTTYPFIEAR